MTDRTGLTPCKACGFTPQGRGVVLNEHQTNEGEWVDWHSSCDDCGGLGSVYNGEPLTPEQIADVEAFLWCREHGYAISKWPWKPGEWTVGLEDHPAYSAPTLALAVARAREASE